ncbi:lyase family protein, partial [Caldivirga sp. UBA161]|uniref:lyase family protein n=1 Tax=Caldivirga sp. UBA161 TaxID=1915569 RepID=UPI0025B8BD7E
MKYVEAASRPFMNTGIRFPRQVIWAMGLVKYACAKVNTDLSLLDADLGEAIMQASREVMEGKFDYEVTVDVFQTGSGTGLNMNINEIIAERASEISGRRVHPNDHVNLGQSSNDTVSTAIRIAAAYSSESLLIPALNKLTILLSEKSTLFDTIIKAGRTHLRDVLPITLGQELSGYLDAFSHDLKIFESALDYVKELPIGGTAVGTGLNSHPEFQGRVVREINEVTSLGFKPANKFRGLRLLTDMLNLSGALRTMAINLYRLGQDVRLMFSGPMTGLNEIDLPTQEEVAGSSIMPGKTNPITVEATLLVVAQVVGLDYANQ